MPLVRVALAAAVPPRAEGGAARIDRGFEQRHLLAGLTAVAVEAVAHPEGLGIERLVLAGVDA